MKQITEITSDSKQELIITTDAGDEFTLNLNYSDLQQCWFYNITFGTTIINGRRIVTSPNILRVFKNILPFGISIISTDQGEPIFLDDFTTERITLYVLEEDEVEEVENTLYQE